MIFNIHFVTNRYFRNVQSGVRRLHNLSLHWKTAASRASCTQLSSKTYPIDTWSQLQPVNALEWWLQKKRRGKTYGKLLTMALDVLSCLGMLFLSIYVFFQLLSNLVLVHSFKFPAMSVNMEHAFSFGRDYVTLKRHRLSAVSVSRGMMVSFYSKK